MKFTNEKAFHEYVAENGAKFEGDLDLSGCTALTSLPVGLTVSGGWLSLYGCSALTSLPEGLKVGGHIYGKPAKI